jgi:hypothetical protein
MLRKGALRNRESLEATKDGLYFMDVIAQPLNHRSP